MDIGMLNAAVKKFKFKRARLEEIISSYRVVTRDIDNLQDPGSKLAGISLKLVGEDRASSVVLNNPPEQFGTTKLLMLECLESQKTELENEATEIIGEKHG